MSAQIKYQVSTIQANTGKSKPCNLENPFNGMYCTDFRRHLARQEHVPMSSIQLVDYDKTKFDFNYEKEDNVLISNVYTNNIVKY